MNSSLLDMTFVLHISCLKSKSYFRLMIAGPPQHHFREVVYSTVSLKMGE